MRNPRLAITVAWALGLLACVGETETTYTDVGRVCVSGEPDATHTVEVDFHVCLSSSCDEVVESICGAQMLTDAVSGETTVIINASATVRSSGGACTADCGQLLATCDFGALPAGTYDLVYGDLQGTLTVPTVVGEPTCLGEE